MKTAIKYLCEKQIGFITGAAALLLQFSTFLGALTNREQNVFLDSAIVISLSFTMISAYLLLAKTAAKMLKTALFIFMALLLHSSAMAITLLAYSSFDFEPLFLAADYLAMSGIFYGLILSLFFGLAFWMAKKLRNAPLAIKLIGVPMPSLMLAIFNWLIPANPDFYGILVYRFFWQDLTPGAIASIIACAASVAVFVVLPMAFNRTQSQNAIPWLRSANHSLKCRIAQMPRFRIILILALLLFGLGYRCHYYIKSSEHYMAYYYIGAAYEKRQDYDKAIEQYQKILELEPYSFLAYSSLGNVYDSKQDYDKAIECHQKAIELEPGYGWAYNNVAAAYAKKQDYDKAIEHYQKAVEYWQKHIELNPKFERSILTEDIAMAYKDIGWAYAKKQGYDMAVEYCKKSIGLLQEEPERIWAYTAMPWAQYSIGFAYAGRKDYHAAIEHYKKAIELFEQLPEEKYYRPAHSVFAQLPNGKYRLREAYYDIGRAYEAIGDKEKALEYKNKAKELGYEPQ